MKQHNDLSNFGVAMGLLFCGLVLIGFPKVAPVPLAVAWIFYIIGLIVLLIGILGACIEIGKK